MFENLKVSLRRILFYLRSAVQDIEPVTSPTQIRLERRFYNVRALA